jgi:hypothetical protein
VVVDVGTVSHQLACAFLSHFLAGINVFGCFSLVFRSLALILEQELVLAAKLQKFLKWETTGTLAGGQSQKFHAECSGSNRTPSSMALIFARRQHVIRTDDNIIAITTGSVAVYR